MTISTVRNNYTENRYPTESQRLRTKCCYCDKTFYVKNICDMFSVTRHPLSTITNTYYIGPCCKDKRDTVKKEIENEVKNTSSVTDIKSRIEEIEIAHLIDYRKENRDKALQDTTSLKEKLLSLMEMPKHRTVYQPSVLSDKEIDKYYDDLMMDESLDDIT